MGRAEREGELLDGRNDGVPFPFRSDVWLLGSTQRLMSKEGSNAVRDGEELGWKLVEKAVR